MDLSAPMDVPEIAERLRLVEQISQELSAQRLSASSADELVAVLVDGHGELLDLRLDPDVLDTATPTQLGESVMAVVAAARAAAADLSAQWMHTVGEPTAVAA